MLNLKDFFGYVQSNASVTNKVNKETISFPVDLMQVPLITSMGLKIDGTFYEVCPIIQEQMVGIT